MHKDKKYKKLVANRMGCQSCSVVVPASLSVSDGDGSDLLDDLGGGVEVDHPLVDPQLEPVPGLGTLTARGLPGGDPQGLSGHPHWALDLQLLLLGSLDQVGADLLQALDRPGGQGDPDPVDHLLLAGATFAILVSRHDLFVSDRVMLG